MCGFYFASVGFSPEEMRTSHNASARGCGRHFPDCPQLIGLPALPSERFILLEAAVLTGDQSPLPYFLKMVISVLDRAGEIRTFSKTPPTLEGRFESRLGLECPGFSVWHFLELVVRRFLRVLRFPPLLHRLIISASKIKLK